jgi:hypothetical protein
MNNNHQLPSYIPLGVLALALLVLTYRLFLGEVFVWGLPTLQFYPWRVYALDLLQNGQLPLWSPFNGAGVPLLANYQSSLLYPFSWTSFVLPPAWAMSVTAVLHLFIAGCGMWAYTGRLGYTALGRGFSTLAFGLTSYLMARLGTFPMIQAAAWLPWLMWAAHRLITLRQRRDAAWLAVFSSLLLLAGHAQTAWYSLLLTGLFSLWLWVTTPPLRWQTLFGLVAAVLLGAGVAALQIVATGELLLSSQRASGVDYHFAVNFSFHPLRTLNFISPNLFGTPADGSYLPAAGAYFEDAVYIGLVPLVSAGAGLLAWLRTRNQSERPSAFRLIPFWLVTIIAAFIFAMGQHSPVFPFLYENIPTFNLFQAPVRWHLWTVFGLSILAGAGVFGWRRTPQTRRWTQRLTAVCAAGLLVGGFGALALRESDNASLAVMLGSVGLTGLIGVLAGLLAVSQPEPSNPRYARWSLLALLLVAFDLVWAGWGLNPTTRDDFGMAQASSETARSYWTPQAEETMRFDTYFQFNDYRETVERWDDVRTSLLPNLNVLDRVSLLNNFDPLRPEHYAQYMTLLEREFAASPEALLKAAGVGAVFEETGARRNLPGDAARAWLVGAACWQADDIATADALTAAAFDPQRVVYVFGSGECQAQTAAPSAGQVTFFADAAATTVVNVSAPEESWLVLADTYYPGWRAEVNGRSAEIQRANLAFRAVLVPQGTSTVRFTYAPDWLFPGMAISGVSLLVLLVLARSGAIRQRN